MAPKKGEGTVQRVKHITQREPELPNRAVRQRDLATDASEAELHTRLLEAEMAAERVHKLLQRFVKVALEQHSP